VTEVDARDILQRLVAIPVQRWSYAAQGPSIVHLGPMAQDFAATFGLGEDERYISTIDADGVALAAIQGLHALVVEKEAKILALRGAVATLEARVAHLERLVTAIP
jgi:hypothetical protein